MGDWLSGSPTSDIRQYLENLEEKSLKIKYEYNGKFMTVIQKIVGTIILSVLWLVCCIPVFTIGPSSRALYHAADWVLGHDLGYPAKTFFREFRKQFKKTVAVWIPFMIISALILINMYLWNHMQTSRTVGLTVLVILSVFLLFVFVWCAYLFAYLSFFDGDNKRTSVKTSYFMLLTHPLKSLAIFVLFVLCVMVFYRFPFTIIFLPAIIAFLQSVLLENVLKEYTDPELWEQRREFFRIEKEKYDQELDDRAQEILHGSGGDDYIDRMP